MRGSKLDAMAWASLRLRVEVTMANREGTIKEYRPHEDHISGGRDKSVQNEALGAEGASDLQSSGSSSGGAAGRFSSPDHNPTPRRDGGKAEKP
ncbi:MAG: hypothetical protein ACTHQM_22920 [Thermoanaerobaculia bacterium]